MGSYSQKIKKKFLPRIIAPLAKGLLKALKWTCSIRIEGEERFRQAATTAPCIVLFWHNRLALIPEILIHIAPEYRYAALISNSRDGEWIARLTNSYPQGRSIRVPHDKRAQALQEAIKELKKGKEVLVVTPDGPRGPKYRVKPGVTLAAKKSGALVVPISWQANRFWKLKTWDGFMIPKPFSTLTIKVGEAIFLSDDTSGESKEGKKSQLQQETLLLENALKNLLYTS